MNKSSILQVIPKLGRYIFIFNEPPVLRAGIFKIFRKKKASFQSLIFFEFGIAVSNFFKNFQYCLLLTRLLLKKLCVVT